MLLYERTKCEALHQEILFSGFVIYKPALFYMKMMRLLTKATRMASIRGICCLSSLGARWDFGQRQLDRPPTGISAAFQDWDQDAILAKGNQIGPQPAYLLLFKFETKMRFWSKATGSASIRHICCLWHIRASLGFQQRQPDGPPTGISAAFGTFDQDWVFSRGNQMGPQSANLLPLVHSSKFGVSAKATKMASNRHICCLWSFWASLVFLQRQPNRPPTDRIAAFDLLSKISEPRQVSRARLEL